MKTATTKAGRIAYASGKAYIPIAGWTLKEDQFDFIIEQAHLTGRTRSAMLRAIVEFYMNAKNKS